MAAAAMIEEKAVLPCVLQHAGKAAVAAGPGRERHYALLCYRARRSRVEARVAADDAS